MDILGPSFYGVQIENENKMILRYLLYHFFWYILIIIRFFRGER